MTARSRLAVSGAVLLFVVAALVPWLRQEILFKNTRDALQNAPPPEALLAARHLWRSFPRDREAALMFAKAHQRAAELPSANERDQLLRAFPDHQDLGIRIALLEFQAGELAQAAQRLNQVDPKLKNIDANRLAIMITHARGDNPSAVTAADQLLKQVDADSLDKLAAAKILLQSPRGVDQTDAIQVLKQLTTTSVQFEAWKTLAMQPHDPMQSEAAQDALAEMFSTRTDEIFIQLDLLAARGHPGLARQIVHAMDTIRTAEASTRLVGWLNAHGRASEALAWSEQLPSPVQETHAMQFALAESSLYAGDREGLYRRLIQNTWQQDESIRLALIALCFEDTANQQRFWSQAIATAERHRTTERLFSVLNQWGIQYPEVSL